jgi:hypothetical protein
LATVSLDFKGVGVTASSTGPGTVRVDIPMIDDYGRVSLQADQVITGTGLYTVEFDYTWLDPNTSWDGSNFGWRLPAGVYEIGTNITASNTPGRYAVRIFDSTAGTVLAIANSVSHATSDYEHTTHISTIIAVNDVSNVIQIQVDLPYVSSCIINGEYGLYTPFDNASGIRVLTDFWYHKLQ